MVFMHVIFVWCHIRPEPTEIITKVNFSTFLTYQSLYVLSLPKSDNIFMICSYLNRITQKIMVRPYLSGQARFGHRACRTRS